jgi:AraC family ethanolamine operon transcriptional activator
MTLAHSTATHNGFRRASRIMELAQHTQILTDWSLRYDQLSKGRFEGNIREVWIDGVQLYEEELSQSVFQRGSGRANTLCLGVFHRQSQEAIWRGKTLSCAEVSWLADGAEVMMKTPQYSSFLALSIPLQLLDSAPQQLKHSASAVHHPALAQAIRQQILATLQGITEHPLQMVSKEARQQFKSEICELVLSFIDSAKGVIPSRHSIQKAQRVVANAQDAMMAHQDTPLTMDQLCQLTHTSRRTLQNCFEVVCGQSPAVFLKNLRLNGVRRSLVLEDQQFSVSDVAALWGFWHLSQFTADYKRLFGELPSSTLKALRKLH